jgi:hypothetical protein
VQIAVRSYLTAGVAAVGVTALAVSPIAPPAPTPFSVPSHTSVSAVELSALVNPIEVFAPIFEQAIGDIGALAQRWLESPAPILEQIIANNLASAQKLVGIATTFGESLAAGIAAAPGQLKLAMTQIQAGQITLAMNTLAEIVLMPILTPLVDSIFSGQGVLQDLVAVVQQPLNNLSKVVGLLGDYDFMLTIGLLPLQMVYAMNTAIGGTIEAVVTAARDLDLEGVINAITVGAGNTLSAVVDTLLNPGTPPYNYDQGLVAALLSARDKIAAIIAPQVPVAAAREESALIDVESPAPTDVSTITSPDTVDTVTVDVTPVSGAVDPVQDGATPEPETPTNVPASTDLESETSQTPAASAPAETPDSPREGAGESPTKSSIRALHREIRETAKETRDNARKAAREARADRISQRAGSTQDRPSDTTDSGSSGSESSGTSNTSSTSDD